MRILFVHAATSMSIGDVGRGYRSALERQGHEITDYSMARRFHYHKGAIPADDQNMEMISRFASETILNEALYNNVDLVLIICGLNVHPIALWLLGKSNIPAAVIFTESPYDDASQMQWADLSHVHSSVDLTIFTNDRYSAMKHGWHLLAPAFDPAIHRPVEADPAFAADVTMVGTGWPERQEFLEAVNWTGIDLKLFGLWPGLLDGPPSPLSPFHRPGIIDNGRISSVYAAAKMCINFHRVSLTALTPGPRVYEAAASGVLMLSDPREDMVQVFGDGIPTFNTPQELEQLIRHYLADEDDREVKTARALDRVLNETFDVRAEELVTVIEAGSRAQVTAQGN